MRVLLPFLVSDPVFSSTVSLKVVKYGEQYDILNQEILEFTCELYQFNEETGAYDAFIGEFTSDLENNILLGTLDTGKYVVTGLMAIQPDANAQNYWFVWGEKDNFTGGIYFEVDSDEPLDLEVNCVLLCEMYRQWYGGKLETFGCVGGEGYMNVREYVQAGCESNEAIHFECEHGCFKPYAIYGTPATGHDHSIFVETRNQYGYLRYQCAKCGIIGDHGEYVWDEAQWNINKGCDGCEAYNHGEGAHDWVDNGWGPGWKRCEVCGIDGYFF